MSFVSGFEDEDRENPQPIASFSTHNSQPILTHSSDMLKLNAKELRTTTATEEQKKSVKKNPIYIILDNVLDTYNIGSVFRLADAVSAKQIFLCGETLTPPNTRIKKASINTTEWVEWEYCKTAEEAIEKLKIKDKKFKTHIKNQKLRIIAVEQDKKSIPYDKVDYQFPVAIIVGNETYGISKSALQMADQIVELPMFGVNKSLNVMVSLGIVLYEIVKKLEK